MTQTKFENGDQICSEPAVSKERKMTADNPRTDEKHVQFNIPEEDNPFTPEKREPLEDGLMNSASPLPFQALAAND